MSILGIDPGKAGALVVVEGDRLLLDVTILGDPIGKGRPRVTTRGGFARAYTPEKTATWESNAAVRFAAAWGQPAIDAPMQLFVEAVKARPTSTPKRNPGRLWRTTKPDGDNVLKAVADALVAAGVLVDDTRIVRWGLDSLTAAIGEGPSVRVVLVRMDVAVADAACLAIYGGRT